MTERWISQPRKFCEYCRVWIADNKISIQIHEQGKSHKENIAKYIEEVKKKGTQVRKEEEELKRQMAAIEAAALAAARKDVASNPSLSKDSSVKGKLLQPSKAPQSAGGTPGKDKPTTTPTATATAAATAAAAATLPSHPAHHAYAAHANVPGVDPAYAMSYYSAYPSEAYASYGLYSPSGALDHPPLAAATPPGSGAAGQDSGARSAEMKREDKAEPIAAAGTASAESAQSAESTQKAAKPEPAAPTTPSPYGVWQRVEKPTVVNDHVGIKDPNAALMAQAQLNAAANGESSERRAGTAHFVESDEEADYKVTFGEKTVASVAETHGFVSLPSSDNGSEKVMFKKRKAGSQAQPRKKPEVST